jgi:hypothetical protein
VNPLPKSSSRAEALRQDLCHLATKTLLTGEPRVE